MEELNGINLTKAFSGIKNYLKIDASKAGVKFGLPYFFYRAIKDSGVTASAGGLLIIGDKFIPMTPLAKPVQGATIGCALGNNLTKVGSAGVASGSALYSLNKINEGFSKFSKSITNSIFK